MPNAKKSESKSGPPARQAGGPAVPGPANSTQAVIAQKTLAAFTGPIPPAELLEKYNQVLPGLAETIVSWTSQEIEHRHSMERGMLEMETQSVQAASGDSRLGLWLGFVLGFCLLAVSAILAFKDHPWAAVSLGGGTLCGLVGTFVYGSRKMMQSTQDPAPEPRREDADA